MGQTLLKLLILLVVVGLVLYVPQVFHQDDSTSTVSRQDCTLQLSECSTHIAMIGEVSLAIEPASMPAMKPLLLMVTIPDSDVDAVSLQFVGQDMDMGLQPVTLSRDPLNPQHWKGEGTISLCTVNPDMIWLARLTVVSGKPHIAEFLLGATAHEK